MDKTALCQFCRENGFRELEPEDFTAFVRYFDLDGDKKLNYHDFIQVLLPCENAFLRAAATQRPNNEVPKGEFLHKSVERALSQLIFKEVRYQLKVDQLKRQLENQYDFSFKKAFQAIDDWTYGYLDRNNIKRFLRSAGHVATSSELTAILRRFDMDGDAKINYKEFEMGFKSGLTVFSKEKNRPKSSGVFKSQSRSVLKGQKSHDRLLSPKNSRPETAGRKYDNRKRETELMNAQSMNYQGPNSNYYLQQDDAREPAPRKAMKTKAVLPKRKLVEQPFDKLFQKFAPYDSQIKVKRVGLRSITKRSVN